MGSGSTGWCLTSCPCCGEARPSTACRTAVGCVCQRTWVGWHQCPGLRRARNPTPFRMARPRTGVAESLQCPARRPHHPSPRACLPQSTVRRKGQTAGVLRHACRCRLWRHMRHRAANPSQCLPKRRLASPLTARALQARLGRWHPSQRGFGLRGVLQTRRCHRPIHLKKARICKRR